MPRSTTLTPTAPAPTRDIALQNSGSIWLFHPLTPAASDWMEEHCPADGEHQYMGKALCVEARYVEQLANLAGEDGLIL